MKNNHMLGIDIAKEASRIKSIVRFFCAISFLASALFVWKGFIGNESPSDKFYYFLYGAFLFFTAWISKSFFYGIAYLFVAIEEIRKNTTNIDYKENL